jgi:L-threonylcarbamoyladenylate synthase
VLVLDGGSCRVGVESTVVDLTSPKPALLRPGGIAKSAIERVLGQTLRRIRPENGDGARLSPGQLASHYAPRARVRLGVRHPGQGEAFLAFGGVPAGIETPALDLSPQRNLAEAAANLFAMLRSLDRPGVMAIAVAPIPRRGLGLAINDRLERAAAPR